MRIATACFDYDDRFDFHRLLEVFQRSVSRNMPGVEIDVLNVKPPKTVYPGNMLSWSSNTAKLRAWAKYVATITENTVICDCDMLCLRSIEPAFEQPFDIAYTERTTEHIPMNGGMLFVRPTDASRAFFQRWHEVNLRMYRDKTLHFSWKRRYAGMNQAAFGYMIAHEPGVQLQVFPCREWNACNEDWPHIDESTRMVHVKGALRKYVLADVGMAGVPGELQRAVGLWREYAG